MRVTCITATLKPDGGTGRMSLEIVERLRRRGITCQVVTQHADQDEAQAGLLPSDSISNLVRNAIMVRRLCAGSEIVHAFDAWPYGIYGLAAVIGTKKRLFINGVGTYSLMGQVRASKRLLLALAYRRAARVFCVSRYMEQKVRRYVPKAKTEVVYLGCTPLLAVSGEYLMRVSADRKLEHASPVILTVGGIKPRKGQLDTLDAILTLRKKYASITYVVVGGSHDREYVSSMQVHATAAGAPDALRILHDVRSREELSALFALCDIYALNATSSDKYVEGFGLSIIEAASVGKLAVASTDNGTEEAVDPGRSGFLAPQHDVHAIARAIEQALAIPREEAALRAKAWAASFSWDATVEAYIAAYHAVT